MSSTVFKHPRGYYYLRLFLSGQEVWTSLRTKDHSVAELRAAVLNGRIASAKLVQSGGQSMTRAAMKEIVKRFVGDIIERGEEDRASRTKITENEREATYYGLSDAFDAASDQLRRNDLTAITPTVDELMTTHGLSLEKGSTEYRLFSRLVLQGFMAALKVEGERWDGVEEAIDFNSSPTAAATTRNGASHATPAPPSTKLLSEVITAYFKEHKREPRTDSQIKSGFKKFTKAIGGIVP